jgi:hypothetical protein
VFVLLPGCTDSLCRVRPGVRVEAVVEEVGPKLGTFCASSSNTSSLSIRFCLVDVTLLAGKAGGVGGLLLWIGHVAPVAT